MTIIWSPRAIAELESEASWIAVDRPRAARAFIEKMLNASARLGEYPCSGKHVQGHSDLPIRELVVAPYQMMYVPQPRKVSIVTLKHSREKLTKDGLVLESSESEDNSEW